MTKLLEQAIAQLDALSEEEQDRAAEVLLALARDQRDYRFSAEQIEGIKHAMEQADRGEFASAAQLKAIFGKDL